MYGSVPSAIKLQLYGMNPIEHAFSSVKAFLVRNREKCRRCPIAAIMNARKHVTGDKAGGTNCGYDVVEVLPGSSSKEPTRRTPVFVPRGGENFFFHPTETHIARATVASCVCLLRVFQDTRNFAAIWRNKQHSARKLRNANAFFIFKYLQPGHLIAMSAMIFINLANFLFSILILNAGSVFSCVSFGLILLIVFLLEALFFDWKAIVY